jgi:tRNA (guanine37-N1)-methyltransferase
MPGVARCCAARNASASEGRESVVLLSPQGQMFTQAVAQEMMSRERMVLICGRYEGVDERVSQHLADREISVGDFVLSGGELAAAVIVDAMTRLVPEALGNAASSQQESFTASTRMLSRTCRVSRQVRRAVRAACWITRITRGRQSFVGCRFPRC